MTGIVTVAVELGNRAYNILIGPGLIARGAELIQQRLPKARAAIVTDENVAALYLKPLVESLSASGNSACDHQASGWGED